MPPLSLVCPNLSNLPKSNLFTRSASSSIMMYVHRNDLWIFLQVLCLLVWSHWRFTFWAQQKQGSFGLSCSLILYVNVSSSVLHCTPRACSVGKASWLRSRFSSLLPRCCAGIDNKTFLLLLAPLVRSGPCNNCRIKTD